MDSISRIRTRHKVIDYKLLLQGGIADDNDSQKMCTTKRKPFEKKMCKKQINNSISLDKDQDDFELECNAQPSHCKHDTSMFSVVGHKNFSKEITIPGKDIRYIDNDKVTTDITTNIISTTGARKHGQRVRVHSNAQILSSNGPLCQKTEPLQVDITDSQVVQTEDADLQHDNVDDNITSELTVKTELEDSLNENMSLCNSNSFENDAFSLENPEASVSVHVPDNIENCDSGENNQQCNDSENDVIGSGNCLACHAVLDTLDAVQVHRQCHHHQAHRDKKKSKPEPCVCQICGKTFQKKIYLTRHAVVHTGEKPFSCELCGKTFNQMANLSTHRKTHANIKRYECDICHEKFAQKRSLVSHKWKHVSSKADLPFQCLICGNHFSTKYGWKVHQRTHTGDCPYKCTVCPKAFADASRLQRHMLKHTGDTPYLCSICGKKLYQNDHLKIHMRTHTGYKPHICSVCGRGFAMSCALRRHLLTHTGERPFQCPKCPQSFKQSCNLNAHIRIHTGDKPFKCDKCGVKYTQYSSLYTHKKSDLHLYGKADNATANNFKSDTESSTPMKKSKTKCQGNVLKRGGRKKQKPPVLLASDSPNSILVVQNIDGSLPSGDHIAYIVQNNKDLVCETSSNSTEANFKAITSEDREFIYLSSDVINEVIVGNPQTDMSMFTGSNGQQYLYVVAASTNDSVGQGNHTDGSALCSHI